MTGTSQKVRREGACVDGGVDHCSGGRTGHRAAQNAANGRDFLVRTLQSLGGIDGGPRRAKDLIATAKGAPRIRAISWLTPDRRPRAEAGDDHHRRKGAPAHGAAQPLVDLPKRSHDTAAGIASSETSDPLIGGGNQEEGVPGPEATQARTRPHKTLNVADLRGISY